MSTGGVCLTGTGAGSRDSPAPSYRARLTLGGGVTALIVVALAARLATRAFVSIAPTSARIAIRQARQPPVEYQAARDLARQPRPLIVGLEKGDRLDI